MSRIWWAEFLLCHCFWLVTRLQQSLTYSASARIGFPYGCADAAATDGQLGSNVYEVNQWLWQFGRGKPRLGGLAIEVTSERMDAVGNALHKRAADSEQRQCIIARRLQPDSKYMVLYDSKYEYVRVYTSMYEYVSGVANIHDLHIPFCQFWLQNTMCCA